MPYRLFVLVVQRMGGTLTLPVAAGFSLMVSNEDDHYPDVVYDGLSRWERNSQALWAILSLRSKSIVDVGGYLGFYSIFARNVNPDASILCLEPNPATFEKLVRNLEVNNIDDIELIQVAAGKVKTSLTLKFPIGRPYSSGASLRDVSDWDFQSVLVSQVPLDELVEKADLIKVDAEGWELDVLEGAKGLISTSRPHLFLEILQAEQFELLQNFLEPHSYEFCFFLGQSSNLLLSHTSEWLGAGNYLWSVRDLSNIRRENPELRNF